jgi:hypothetical protein
MIHSSLCTVEKLEVPVLSHHSRLNAKFANLEGRYLQEIAVKSILEITFEYGWVCLRAYLKSKEPVIVREHRADVPLPAQL